MEYLIARGGQTFGPYTEAEVREYLISGNLIETDLARTEDMKKWVPLRKVLPKLKKPKKGALDPTGLRMNLPAPPDMPWQLLLGLEVVTSFTFALAWDTFQTIWMRRVQRSSSALFYYIAAGLLFLADAKEIFRDATNLSALAAFRNPMHVTYLTVVFAIVMLMVARFSMRKSLLEHFNLTEPIGLRLSWWWTLLFGGVYFQYHFNRINEMRRALNPAPPTL